MPLASGIRLGPYEILALVGAGGMGEVNLASDTRFERTVGIKVLPPQLADDPQFRERLERGAKMISRLNHPHICMLYDVGDQDGVRYLVMEYLEDETLARKLAGPGKTILIDRPLTFATQIADALNAAHRAGITHRDLKRGNVMVTKAGVKLLDIGLAKTAVEAGLQAGPTAE